MNVKQIPNQQATDKLVALLTKARILSADQISHAINERSGPYDSLESILMDKKMVSRSTLITMLMDYYQIPFISLPEKINLQVLKMLPEHIIEAYKAVPLSFDGTTLTVAMTVPNDAKAIDRMAAATGYKIAVEGILESDFKQFFSKYFEDTPMLQILKEIEVHQKDLSLPKETENQDDPKSRPMIKLVDTILNLAVRKRASDIHIEPQDGFALLRFRIDGLLQTQQIIPRNVVAGLTTRLKVLAGLDITDRRIPQDGQFRCKVSDRSVDIRMATIPSRYGEKLALRVLDRKNFLMSTDLLGMPDAIRVSLDQITNRPNGLVLVTGPTGSGKTTTLYALLQNLRSPRQNIMTLEDPIEYELLSGSKREGGITQIQINPKVGLTFASGLRACLRQDPDIIFVGEIRDRETAETAISASLTGHMVLSSLHTNGAIQTVTRLLDMGVEPFLVVSAIRGIVSQRLVRVLCHHCKKPYQPPKEALQRLGLQSNQDICFYKPVGCGNCLEQGYWGRTGVFEMIPLENKINNLILEKRPPGEIFAEAKKNFGFKTLKGQGLDLVTQGITTIEEVLRELPNL